MQSKKVWFVNVAVAAVIFLGLPSPCAADNATSAVGTNFWGFSDNQYTWPLLISSSRAVRSGLRPQVRGTTAGH